MLEFSEITGKYYCNLALACYVGFRRIVTIVVDNVVYGFIPFLVFIIVTIITSSL